MAPIVPFIPLIVSTFAGAAASKLLSPKSKAEKQLDAGPPTVPVPPSTSEVLKTAVPASVAAAVQQKKKATAAAGVSSNLLTGPSGLGNIDSSNLGYKTILGG